MTTKQKSGSLVTGLVAGITAGLLIPIVAKKAHTWATSKEGKKALKEILPTNADREQAKSLWNRREELVQKGLKTVRKHVESLVQTTQSQAEETLQDTKEAVEKVQKNVAEATAQRKKAVRKTAKTKSSKSVKKAKKTS